jgi:4-alpha-glucanotransferase
MKLSVNQLLAGILEPVFAIRTEEDLGIGDVAGVRQMIDWCHRHRLNIFQTLPINELGEDNSPYNALSSLAIEPTTLALSPREVPDLTESDFARIASPAALASLRTGPVKYQAVKTLKRKLLEAAFATFFKKEWGPKTSRARQFETFQAQNSHWLADYALFRLLLEQHGESTAWTAWPAEHRSPALARAWFDKLSQQERGPLDQRRLFFVYVQWLAFSQWQALKAYGASKAVYLMGDIPYGVGRFSADVWANPDIFDLEWSGGAPPEKTFKVDRFTEKWGQNWGVPDYRWDQLRARNFDWWRTRAGNIQKTFHLYRIDHVLGLFRIYSFPWTPDRNAEFLPLSEDEAAAKTGGRLPGFKPFPDDTAEHRAANQAQGEEILRMILEASGETAVIAEDLGVVPDYVPPTLQKLGVPGFRIPMFFRDGHGFYSSPKQYPRLSVAQPATHDHPPLAAAWAECWQNIDAGVNVEGNRHELRALMQFAGLGQADPNRDITDDFLAGFTRAVMSSGSWLVLFQITDVFGMTARFNTPGSVGAANWSYRLPQTVRELETDPVLKSRAAQFSRLAQENDRGTASR